MSHSSPTSCGCWKCSRQRNERWRIRNSPTRSYPDDDFDDDGKIELYKVPVYEIAVAGTDDAHRPIQHIHKAPRFMPYDLFKSHIAALSGLKTASADDSIAELVAERNLLVVIAKAQAPDIKAQFTREI